MGEIWNSMVTTGKLEDEDHASRQIQSNLRENLQDNTLLLHILGEFRACRDDLGVSQCAHKGREDSFHVEACFRPCFEEITAELSRG